mmetsp:Transcript_10620/g.12899  ORF Transcript_10620/g.12899 Transcript_10620/m.12899 type:complete len:166 (+) Transcript_10620:47-544(+)
MSNNIPLPSTQEKDQNARLHATIKTNLDVYCSRLVKDFKGIVSSSHIDNKQQTSQKSQVNCENDLRLNSTNSEQEQLRRDGFHLSVHAEKICATSEALLSLIHNIRQNIILGDTDAINGEMLAFESQAKETISNNSSLETLSSYSSSDVVGTKRKACDPDSPEKS